MPAGRLVRIHPPGKLWWLRGRLPETRGQAAEQRSRMAGSHELVAGGTAFGLRALRGQQVTEIGRAADQLTCTGYLEALGNGLFCLLHGWSGPKQRAWGRMARGKFDDRDAPKNEPLEVVFQRENCVAAEIRKRG